MKKLSFLILLVAFAVAPVFGQESATQQQLDKLSGQFQDLLEAQAQQGKRLDALAKEVGELREKVNAPKQTEDNASASDLKALAEKVQEVDRKRQKDNEGISRQIENLGKVVAGAPIHVKPTPNRPPPSEAGTPEMPQTGHYYVVQAGDTWQAIAKAYSDQGVKVTWRQLVKANPKMNPDMLIVGKKIFIPDPNAK